MRKQDPNPSDLYRARNVMNAHPPLVTLMRITKHQNRRPKPRAECKSLRCRGIVVKEGVRWLEFELDGIHYDYLLSLCSEAAEELLTCIAQYANELDFDATNAVSKVHTPPGGDGTTLALGQNKIPFDKRV